MEILINARRAGFAQGFVKLSCHKRPGRPLLAREVHRSLVALCSALARIPHFPSASSTLPRRSLGALALPPPCRHGASAVLPCKEGWGSLTSSGWAGPISDATTGKTDSHGVRIQEATQPGQEKPDGLPESLALEAIISPVYSCADVCDPGCPAGLGRAGEGEDPTTVFTAPEAAGSVTPR